MGNNPWSMDPSLDGGASQGPMAQVYQQGQQSKLPPVDAAKKSASLGSILSPMRAIEKDPLLSMATGNKWTPVDPALSGQRAQALGTGSNNGFNAQTPWGQWSP